MITGFFLIPTKYTGDRKLPLDYKVERKPMDKRTRFFRINAKYNTSAYIAVSAAERLGAKVFREDGAVTRILPPDGKTARDFYNYMQKTCDFGKEGA